MLSNSKKRIVRHQKQVILREEIKAMGHVATPNTAAHNRVNRYENTDAEKDENKNILKQQLKAWSNLLPFIIRHLKAVKDPRCAKKIKHKLASVLLYALLSFVLKMTSRREINRKMSSAQLIDTLHTMFPELESTPHADTINRVLQKVNFEEIEVIAIKLIKNLIRNKTFDRFRIQGGLPISIDATQKLVRNGQQHDNWLVRTIKSSSGERKQQYILILEANITLQNGLCIPLLSEFLSIDCNPNEDQQPQKQDCEFAGFKRLAEKIKRYFPCMEIILFLDALYSNGTVFKICEDYGWSFMSCLKDKQLKSIHQEIELQANGAMQFPQYRGRSQSFRISNEIDYTDSFGNKYKLHVITCFENWHEISKETNEPIKKFAKNIWISNIKFTKNNIHELYNLGARSRWFIEDCFNTEKNRGYNLKHLLSYNWNAIIGFHGMMRLAHLINMISQYTKGLKKLMRENGIIFILETISKILFNPWFTRSEISALWNKKYQLILE